MGMRVLWPGIPNAWGLKESGIPNVWGVGAFWNFRMHGGGKISMPPVVGVQIFSGTTY